MENEPAKHVYESRTEQAYMVRARYLNSAGRLFGGNLMAWIDETGAMTARRHSNMAVTTVAVDNLQFAKPVLQSQIAVLVGQVTHVRNTSMEIRVDTYVEDLSGTRSPVNRAYLLFVAMKDGRPARVPRLITDTEEERQEWEDGEKRAELRMRRRREGF